MHDSRRNIANHAVARRVTIVFLKDAARIQCSVRDDGADLDLGEVLAARSGRVLSLAAIRERVEDFSGTLSIRSGPGQGAELVVSIPLDC